MHFCHSPKHSCFSSEEKKAQWQSLSHLAQDVKIEKEFTESYAALHHFRRSFKVLPECLVLHIGDGAHCRTGALFAFMSRTRNVCIDPGIHPEILVPWMERYRAQRLAWFAVKVEDYPLEDVTETCLVTFVHAHVNTDAVLKRIPNWLAAYVNVCCHPDEQRTKLPTDDAGYDWAILSPEREYQVIINRDAGSVLAHNPVS